MSTPQTIWHSDLAKLLVGDDHTQYALLAGRSGGQTLIGGTASGNDLTLQSTSNATRGSILIASDDMIFSGSRALGSTAGLLDVNATIPSTGTVACGIYSRPNFTAAGDYPIGILAQPVFTPSSSITQVTGFWCDGVCAPPVGVTITLAAGGFSRLLYNDVAGAVTTGMSQYLSAPVVSGALKPTNQYGLNVANQGVAGMTNAIGVHIDAQSGATSNFDMSFGRVDTTAAGAYYGRVPVLYNGLTKYLHVFSA